MELPRSAAVADLRILDQAASTNDVLRELPDAAHFTAVVTLTQTAGRGRLGRVWTAPPGTSLAVSVQLTPRLPVAAWGWLPLLAGSAMTASVQAVLPERSVRLKWPNDVLVQGRKVCGILTEVLPAGDGVVVGAGVNLTIPREALPTATATSLGLEGATRRGDALVDAVLGGYLEALTALFVLFRLRGGDALAAQGAPAIRDTVAAQCATIGHGVRVELPDGTAFAGTATALDAAGRLVVAADDGREVAVTAGDVTHLRHRP